MSLSPELQEVYDALVKDFEFTQRRIDFYMQEAERLDRQLQAIRALDPEKE